MPPLRTILRLLLLPMLGVVLLAPCQAQAGVGSTKHNLSVSGTGDIKAVAETQVCIFCHTPHNATPQTPLWNRALSTASYTPYTSPTLQTYSAAGDAPAIDGTSKLCLGCHDGTIALGAVASRTDDIEMTDVAGVLAAGILQPGAAGYLGTDLSGGHPISFVFDEDLVNKRQLAGLSELRWPVCRAGDKGCGGDRDVRIHPTQGGYYGVQCTSCHNPHENKGGPGEPPLWRKARFEDVCSVCHDTFGTISH